MSAAIELIYRVYLIGLIRSSPPTPQTTFPPRQFKRLWKGLGPFFL